MGNLIQHGINFTVNVNENISGYGTKKTRADLISNDKKYSVLQKQNLVDANYDMCFVNAVDIDWNAAEVGENIIINSTGDLLAWIKDHSSEIDSEQLSEIQNTIELYQETFRNVLTRTYANEHYQEIGDYVTSGEYENDIQNLSNILDELQRRVDNYGIPALSSRITVLENNQEHILNNYATKLYVDNKVGEAIADVVGGAPETLDTLREIADALNDNATMTQVAEAIATKANISDVYTKEEVYNVEEINNKITALSDQDTLLANSISEKANISNVYTKEYIDSTISDMNNTRQIIVDDLTNMISGKVDKELDGANGRALIFNESDGGGAKFEHNDGTWSFAGVNDGGENGIAGQIYALKKNEEDKFEGARIDVTKNGMYYTVGADSASNRLNEANEIATKGDLAAIELTPGPKGEQGPKGDKGDTGEIDLTILEDYATKSFVSEKVADIIGAAPEALDTLQEIAEKLGDNDDVVSSLTNTLAEKANSEDVYTKDEVDALIGTSIETELTQLREENAALLERIKNLERAFSNLVPEEPEDESYNVIVPTSDEPLTLEEIIAAINPEAEKPEVVQSLNMTQLSNPTDTYLVYPLSWEIIEDDQIVSPIIKDWNGFEIGFNVNEDTPTVMVDDVEYRVSDIKLGKGQYTIEFK